jgi:hypothetical protein
MATSYKPWHCAGAPRVISRCMATRPVVPVVDGVRVLVLNGDRAAGWGLVAGVLSRTPLSVCAWGQSTKGGQERPTLR